MTTGTNVSIVGNISIWRESSRANAFVSLTFSTALSLFVGYDVAHAPHKSALTRRFQASQRFIVWPHLLVHSTRIPYPAFLCRTEA
jgi:hypothetical protein